MFHFSLQTALDVRERQEKIKMKELAETLSVEQEIQGRINYIHESLKKSETSLDRQKEEGKLDLDQMKYLFAFKSRMDIALTQLDNSMTEANAETSKRRDSLVEASRAKKTLEIIKDKEKKRTLVKIARIERMEMDEIAGNLFNNRRENFEN